MNAQPEHPQSTNPSRPLNFSGVLPSLSISAELGPPRSELGIGGLMPWNGRLYITTYLSHKQRSGKGAGLYYVTEDFTLHKCPQSIDGTYTNRFIHWGTNQLIIGPHVINARHHVQTLHQMKDVRLTAVMEHLEDPDNKVYLLGMEGEFFEMDMRSLKITHLADLVKELGVVSHEKAHFKAGYTQGGRVVVCNNSYTEEDHKGEAADGRLAEWDGKTWTILEKSPFVEAAGRGKFAPTMFATGWDKASVILKMYLVETGEWKRYRLPKASHCFEHAWQTEWPRIREIEHERFLMDIHGMFYELSPWAFDGAAWGIKPVSQHLWVLGDFCSWKGLLIMGADNASPHQRENVLCAEPQSGLWIGKTDDLWSFGKPAGWGGPWWEKTVEAGEISDPYLMTGFTHKCLHLSHDAGEPVSFDVEVDFLGNETWKTYRTLEVPANGYMEHVFPTGFSAHWVRFRAHKACTAGAYLHYTA